MLFPQELSNGGVVFINAGRSGEERMSATAALKHRFVAQARPSPPSFDISRRDTLIVVCQAVLGLSMVSG